jgi:ribonuclease VapC
VASAFVLDTSALLAYIYGEPGHEVVQKILLGAGRRPGAVRIHRLHLGEMYYILYRKGGRAVAESAMADVEGLPIHVEDRIQRDLMRDASRIKASYRVSYADAYAAALARLRDAVLVSCDRREFGPLESVGEVSMTWVR